MSQEVTDLQKEVTLDYVFISYLSFFFELYNIESNFTVVL